MPMNWTPEVDAKLMAAIVQICDVKPNARQMQEIATMMGPECTPKAIAHRMTNFRKGGAKVFKRRSGGVEKAQMKSTSAKGNGKGDKAQPNGVGIKRGHAQVAGGASDVDDAEEPRVGRNKKVKVEKEEEVVGNGLHATVEDEDEE